MFEVITLKKVMIIGKMIIIQAKIFKSRKFQPKSSYQFQFVLVKDRISKPFEMILSFQTLIIINANYSINCLQG